MRKEVSVVALVLIAVAVAWLRLGGGLSAAEPAEREYFISTDPTIKVLTIKFMGLTSNWVGVFRLFPDGRLVLEYVNAVNSEVNSHYEMQLSDEELSSLVDTAVDGGFIEYDHELWKEKERQVMNSHGGSMWIDLNLEQYRGPGQPEWGPAACSLVVRDPFSLSRRFPDVSTFRAMVQLSLKMRTYRKAMEKSDGQ